ncbi:uncharacterized protein [Engystomops pustulosus]|uniref:uncharacterized protein n=1 Tax=Engystomops pustulosus TaxID=76066 RepID=UPI003AFA2138
MYGRFHSRRVCSQAALQSSLPPWLHRKVDWRKYQLPNLQSTRLKRQDDQNPWWSIIAPLKAAHHRGLSKSLRGSQCTSDPGSQNQTLARDEVSIRLGSVSQRQTMRIAYRARITESDFSPRRHLQSSRQRLPAPDDENSVPWMDHRPCRRSRQQQTGRSRSPLRQEAAPWSSGEISSAVPAPNSIRQRTTQPHRCRGQPRSHSLSCQESEETWSRRQPRSRSPWHTHPESGSHRLQVDRECSASLHTMRFMRQRTIDAKWIDYPFALHAV